MARPGFERRFRDCLASEAFEDKINQFLRRNAATVIRESDFAESKDDNATDESKEINQWEPNGLIARVLLIA